MKKYPTSSILPVKEAINSAMIYPNWFQKDVPYRFEINANLWFKRFNVKGQMMMTEFEQDHVVQFFSDFGKNLLLLKKTSGSEVWQVEYVLPEMNHPGLLRWIMEDLDVFFVNNADYLSSVYKVAMGKYEWLKYLNTARSVVYLQPNLLSPPDRAYLLNAKGKIIKTYLSNGQEVRVEYKKPSMSFKFSELYAVE